MNPLAPSTYNVQSFSSLSLLCTTVGGSPYSLPSHQRNRERRDLCFRNQRGAADVCRVIFEHFSMDSNDIGKNDVLCGRGGAVNEHPGNLQMRGFCTEVVKEYKTAKKLEKRKVAMRVVHRVRALNPPGRFLKKEGNDWVW